MLVYLQAQVSPKTRGSSFWTQWKTFVALTQVLLKENSTSLTAFQTKTKNEISEQGIEKLDSTFLDICKINDDWPKERGLFLNKAKTFCIKVNFLDHLEITYAVEDEGFMEVLDKFVDALSLLETKNVVAKKEGYLNITGIHNAALKPDQISTTCRFAHDQKLGYITTLPKLINEFMIKIYLKVHEDMQPS